MHELTSFSQETGAVGVSGVVEASWSSGGGAGGAARGLDLTSQGCRVSGMGPSGEEERGVSLLKCFDICNTH